MRRRLKPRSRKTELRMAGCSANRLARNSLWALVARGKFQAQRNHSCRRFCQHPMRGAVRLAEKIAGKIPIYKFFLVTMFGLCKISPIPLSQCTGNACRDREFVAAGPAGPSGRAAPAAFDCENDPCATAQSTKFPIFAFSGLLDPIVPWPLVRRWLRRKIARPARLQNHPRRPQRPRTAPKEDRPADFGME